MQITEFWREAAILSKLHHPNILAFYGVVNNGPEATLATVTEFMVNVSLKKVLLGKDRYLDWRKRTMLAMDAAIGMEYLHSKDRFCSLKVMARSSPLDKHTLVKHLRRTFNDVVVVTGHK